MQHSIKSKFTSLVLSDQKDQ